MAEILETGYFYFLKKRTFEIQRNRQ